MSVTEAATAAIEAMLYGEYLEAVTPDPKYTWHTPYTGTFKEWLEREFDEISYGLDASSIWEHLKYEGSKGSYQGITGDRVAEFGGEGEGDRYWMVISASDGLTTRYFRRDGWYASYDGGHLDGDTYEVAPKTKTVVEYE